MSVKRAHLFNPTCEMEVANGTPSYTPPAYLCDFISSLELLPITYAHEGDCILVSQLPPQDFTDRLTQAGFKLPQFKLLTDIKQLDKSYMPSPWGWSPSAAHKLKALGAQWDERLKAFFSREFARDIALRLYNNNLLRIIEQEHIGQKVGSTIDVENRLAQWGNAVIKAPYSSSGRGVQMLRNGQFSKTIYDKTRSLIQQQGFVMLEPLHEVIVEYAYEFEIKDGEVTFIGYSSFNTNENGQYESHNIPFSTEWWPKEAKHLWEIGTINAALDELTKALQDSKLPQHYNGYLGVDAFVLKTGYGKTVIHPCVEINLRNNMGIVALNLEKQIASGSRCIFTIKPKAHVSLALVDMDLAGQYPLVIENEKIRSGYLPLTPPSHEVATIAYILVEG